MLRNKTSSCRHAQLNRITRTAFQLWYGPFFLPNTMLGSEICVIVYARSFLNVFQVFRVDRVDVSSTRVPRCYYSALSISWLFAARLQLTATARTYCGMLRLANGRIHGFRQGVGPLNTRDTVNIRKTPEAVTATSDTAEMRISSAQLGQQSKGRIYISDRVGTTSLSGFVRMRLAYSIVRFPRSNGSQGNNWDVE